MIAKYKKNQKDGILVVDINNLEEEQMDIKYQFYETDKYEIYCFCQIFETNLLLIGGKLYKFNEIDDKLI